MSSREDIGNGGSAMPVAPVASSTAAVLGGHHHQLPGLRTVLGARILAEIGDERTRFASARLLKAFAGTVPITRARGHEDHRHQTPAADFALGDARCYALVR